MDEAAVEAFWQRNPCGDYQVGGLSDSFAGNHAKFFAEYDQYRYSHERHILEALDRFDWRDKDVLEIGLGQGEDSEQLIKRGARWSGLDLTREAVERVKVRADVHQLPIQDIKVGSALDIPYPDDSFDIVFSLGVLHHIPEIERAQAEIARVLRPGGSLIMMVYARHSLNYQLSIKLIRRAILATAVSLHLPLPKRFENHRSNARAIGLTKYLRMDNFVHRSTDGPDNPYAKVYSIEEVKRDFPAFAVAEHFKMWMHAPPLPTGRLPGGNLLGWHLWVRLTPRG